MRKLGTILFVAAILAMALSAGATPIRPDIRKLVAEPSQDTIQFAPARAGWNGSEAAVNNAQFTNPAVERLTPAAARREVRASMLGAGGTRLEDTGGDSWVDRRAENGQAQTAA